MNIHDFLSHHGIAKNPFSEEDARTDRIFKDYCIDNTFHPSWDKIFGNPGDPSTSIVLGEKGAGKTALRLQIEQQIAEYNVEHPHARCFVVLYDDFNPFLDEFQGRVRRHRKPERVFAEFQLWDHIDAILSLAVTQLMDGIFVSRSASKSAPPAFAMPHDYRKRLTRYQRRDLLLLAACYDNSKGAPLAQRWKRLRRGLWEWKLRPWWAFLVGCLVTVALATAIGWALFDGRAQAPPPANKSTIETRIRPVPATDKLDASVVAVAQQEQIDGAQQSASLIDWLLTYWWVWVAILAVGWAPWIVRCGQRWLLAHSIAKRIRVIERDSVPLSRMLASFTSSDLAGQPLPNKDRTDDRYSLLGKLQSILESLDFCGMAVLVDRVDEPHLVNGSTEAMRGMLWPMLDNKFLKQEGFAIKFLLPKELSLFIDREDSDFYQRARLDKQNLIPSLDWTGEALFDLANARLAACSSREIKPKLTDLVDQNVTQQRLFDALRSLKVPRHVFRFLYRLFVAHCNKYSDEKPAWRISAETFESEFAVYRREQEAAERGLATG